MVQQPHTGRYFEHNQFACLNLSTGGKHNNVVIVNPKNIKKHLKQIYATMYVQIHETNMYTHILTKYNTRKIFMTKLFLFNTQNKIFHDRLISLVIQREMFTMYAVVLPPSDQ